MSHKLKVNDLVIAFQKTKGRRSYEDFLEEYPLAVARIGSIYPSGNISIRGMSRGYLTDDYRRGDDFAFAPDDLILVDEISKR